MPETNKEDVKSTTPDHFKVVHSNLVAFPTEGVMLDWEVVDRILKNQMSFEE